MDSLYFADTSYRDRGRKGYRMLATIGYERAELADFIATLQTSDVEILIDIRDRAQSRRKGFSKTALSVALEDAGIGYLHLRELGDPKEGREAARRGDFASFRKIYDDVISSPDGRDALDKIEALLGQSSICLMCYERDHHTCHRKIVSDRLETVTSLRARHLGVVSGAGRGRAKGRVRHTNQSSTASVECVL